MEELNDAEQITLFSKEKLGKRDFSKLYKIYQRKVYEFILKRVSHPQTAEDLTADVFEKILKNINDFQWQGITVSAWIFRIARNHVIDYYRKNSKRKTDSSIEEIGHLLASHSPTVDSEIQSDEAEIGLYNSIRELKEDDQYLVYYKFFEELSNKQISDITGLSETNIGTRLHRIRKKLKSYLSKRNIS
ncbi:sigma-70 family RNA polymerase sigma factor [Candidatus Dojkabacteria bacterium]|uniref:Sigma-70 family RNA polymerase sigma factor n=1 Tax=Candidatus Dojkabacteria bacterium TaxID=2099670 RepID=A0A952AK60_9BACT|nr:sigma-70 family RNA polymerase sigma factor [Candidatus Dojkabacteria bacterium]